MDFCTDHEGYFGAKQFECSQAVDLRNPYEAHLEEHKEPVNELLRAADKHCAVRDCEGAEGVAGKLEAVAALVRFFGDPRAGVRVDDLSGPVPGVFS